ncbi:MAG: LamG domain-containing protein, partial [Sedimentisphaerales bacterium]|nr:LamG domain-containing protein [Sedimentisphaerales bacterium]
LNSYDPIGGGLRRMVKTMPAIKSTAVAGSDVGLSIGAGKNLEAGSFWSGLIDDVKIYDRAVTP